MKKIVLTVMVIFALLISLNGVYGQSADFWAPLAPIPITFNYNIGAGEVSGKIYIIGEVVDNDTSTPYFGNLEYDPSTNTWQNKTFFPESRIGFAVATYQSKIYILGGWLHSEHVVVYDPATDTWEQKAEDPTVGAMGIKANIVNGKIYVIGGVYISPNLFSGPLSPPLNLNEAYDPAADSWTSMEPIPTAVNGYASAVLDGKIYVMGGLNSVEYPNATLSLVQIFDPQTNTWSQGKPMPVSVAHAAATVTTGSVASKRIYVIGGFSANGKTDTVSTNLTQIYDPQTDSWSLGTAMPTARSYLTLTNINDTLYAIGGEIDYHYMSTPTNEKYIPADYSLSHTPNVANPSVTPTNSPTQQSTLSPTQTPILLLTPVENYFPREFLIIVSIVAAVAVVIGLLVYFKKRRMLVNR